MTAETLLEDLLSRDPRRVWEASCAVARSWDARVLDPLAAQLPVIRERTDGLELGGMMFPNREHLRLAIRRLEHHRDRAGCPCELYPEYLMFDPDREAAAGHVRILETVELEGGWVDHYICECTACGARLRVREGESHYTWWEWASA